MYHGLLGAGYTTLANSVWLMGSWFSITVVYKHSS